MSKEAFSRVGIDAQFRDQGWDVTNTNDVRFEAALPNIPPRFSVSGHLIRDTVEALRGQN